MTARRLSTYEWSKRFVAPQFPRIAEILEYPMVRTILDRIDQNPGCVFVILGAPQIFKTLIGQLVALRMQMIEPIPALWYAKNSDTAEQVADEKFNPLFDRCMPAVKAKTTATELTPAILYADKNKRTKIRYTLPQGEQLLFLSAGVDINRQGKSASLVLMDEPWEYEAGWINEIQRRREDFPRFREIHMMTGPDENSFSDRLWERSTQEIWHMRCTKPECRKLFPAEVGDGKQPGGIRYDSGPNVRDAENNRIISATKATVRLECPHCGTQHPNSDHSRTALNAGGVLVATNQNAEGNIYGFRCPALPFRDWANIAIENIEASRAMRKGNLKPREDFVRKVEAKTWRENAHLAGEKVKPIGNYAMGDEWPDEAKDGEGRAWRVATVDVQQDYFVLVIRMWGKGARSRGRFAAKPKSETELADLIEAHGVMKERVFVDGRFNSTTVRRMCCRHGWKVLMGDKNQRDYLHDDGKRKVFDVPRIMDAFLGTEQQNQFPGVIEVLFSKHAALNSLQLLRKEVCQPDPTNAAFYEPLFTAAHDMPAWYWTELDAHYMVKEEAKDNTEKWVWRGFKQDHAGDCEAMQIIFASMAGLIGADPMENKDEETSES